MTNYARMYRFGITPWERYATAAAASITALLDQEEAERSRPLGRALDLGCGHGQYPRACAPGVGGRGHRLRTGRDRGGRSEEPGRGRAELRRRRRDAAAVSLPGRADEQDRAAVVQAAPTDLERDSCLAVSGRAPDDPSVRALVPM